METRVRYSHIVFSPAARATWEREREDPRRRYAHAPRTHRARFHTPSPRRHGSSREHSPPRFADVLELYASRSDVIT